MVAAVAERGDRGELVLLGARAFAVSKAAARACCIVRLTPASLLLRDARVQRGQRCRVAGLEDRFGRDLAAPPLRARTARARPAPRPARGGRCC